MKKTPVSPAAAEQCTLLDELDAIYKAPDFAERIHKAQKHINFEDDEMRDLIAQYIADTPEMFKNLNTAWVRNNHADLLLYAHSIVGVARILKLEELSLCAKVIEEDAKGDRRSGSSVLKELNAHHNASLDALRKFC